MEKKFTRAMVCSALEHKCKECPLHYCNNSTALHCWELTNDNVNTIMKDYPYIDVKVRMIFNDIETRLTAVEEKVSNDVKFTFKPGRIVSGDFSTEFVDQKLYDKLEAKHEADCRLISEYDLENKELKDEISVLNKKCGYLERENKTFNVLLINKTNTIADLASKNKILEEQIAILVKENKKLTESNDTATKENLEFEGENDALSIRNAFLEDKIETQKNRIASLESKLRNQRANLTSLQEKYEDAVKMNKAREDVYYANIKLQKTIEAKDGEINLLRAELDKYKTDDECDDRWID